jgi:transcriptional regulator with XRE-family HTH domain
MIKNEQERQRIGNEIATLRKARGMTQQNVADRADIMRPHIARVELGKYNFGFDTLQNIADALDADIRIVPRQK